MNPKTHLRYSLARTSSISRMFQMATRSLCITSKHFFRLKLRKCIPDAIALQYSVNRSEDIEKKLKVRFTLFPYSMIIIRHQVHLILDRYLLYWRVDLTRRIDTLRRCKSNLCCIQKVFNWFCQLIIERAALKECHLPGESPLDKVVDSARIFCLVNSTSRSKVSGWNPG